MTDKKDDILMQNFIQDLSKLIEQHQAKQDELAQDEKDIANGECEMYRDCEGCDYCEGHPDLTDNQWSSFLDQKKWHEENCY